MNKNIKSLIQHFKNLRRGEDSDDTQSDDAEGMKDEVGQHHIDKERHQWEVSGDSPPSCSTHIQDAATCQHRLTYQLEGEDVEARMQKMVNECLNNDSVVNSIPNHDITKHNRSKMIDNKDIAEVKIKKRTEKEIEKKEELTKLNQTDAHSSTLKSVSIVKENNESLKIVINKRDISTPATKNKPLKKSLINKQPKKRSSPK